MHAWLEQCRLIIESSPGLALTSFLTSSLAGIAEILRSSEQLTVRTIAATALHSGLWGLAVSLLLDDYITEHHWMILGVSILSGIGGANVTDFVVTLLRRGLTLRVRLDDSDANGKG